MEPEDRYKITSNEFADLILDGYDEINSLINNPDYTINVIDGKYAVAYIPVSEMTADSVQKFGYASIPKIFALLSTVNQVTQDIIKFNQEPDFNLKGYGVLIGIVDTGIDYTNPVFRNADGTTRIVSIWDQTIDNRDNYPEGLYYGTEYTQKQINDALKTSEPYTYVPSTDTIGHGTMLAGVAAGTPVPEYEFSGTAPDAEIAIVKLKPAKPYLREFLRIPEGRICYQENDIMLGVKYLLDVARRLNRPIAICLGLGTNQGAHEGQCILCQYFNDISQLVGNSVIIAAGNEANRGHHFYGELVPSEGQGMVELNVAENETGFSMEYWGFAPSIVTMDIYAPDNTFVTRIPEHLREEETIEAVYNNTTIIINNKFSETRTDDQFIFIRFQNPQSGIWRFYITGQSDLVTKYHIWLPIYNYILDGTFFEDSNSDTTLSMPANTDNVTAVTAYYPDDQSIFYYSSRGFTKNNAPKPDITAPGVNITAPFIGNMFIQATGTSIAAAHTSGVAAMLLEWGIVRGNMPLMNNLTLKKMLLAGAYRFPDLSYPNQKWGFGILDIQSTLNMFSPKFR
ncbi:S8 family peptidase [Anaerocolumna sp. MB42-C2]|uniref:S8 family peptidase n=1 Tax=Anaerocolumna sp. MB42-C2 TaxID=3070997 RepID=UPI0027E073C5|nr:S8 family peptidase [Anaerocolumna sp. MB42-C2]WMJ88698.1 S8 family peptidase [Anaerocolumna sp. MB42-C2]